MKEKQVDKDTRVLLNAMFGNIEKILIKVHLFSIKNCVEKIVNDFLLKLEMRVVHDESFQVKVENVLRDNG